MSFIPAKEYAQIVKVLPVLCVDVLLKNEAGEYLLVKRTNEPRKGQWWVVGGRVHKGETLEQAARRKIKEELDLKLNSLKPIGYFEDTSEKNRFGLSEPLHSVSVVFLAEVNSAQEIKLDSQSSDWAYLPKMPKDFSVKLFY